MAPDDVARTLGSALSSIVRFVEERPEEATADDDVRALEALAQVVSAADHNTRSRLREFLDSDVADWLDLP